MADKHQRSPTSRKGLQSTSTVFELHEEHPVGLRGLKRHDVLFKVSDRLLRRQLVLHADQGKGFRDVEKSERRAGEDKELGCVGVKLYLGTKGELDTTSDNRAEALETHLIEDEVEFRRRRVSNSNVVERRGRE